MLFHIIAVLQDRLKDVVTSNAELSADIAVSNVVSGWGKIMDSLYRMISQLVFVKYPVRISAILTDIFLVYLGL
jgi:hypothetical protein